MRTPWGESDVQKAFGDGITLYSTPSHGGFKLSAKMNAQVPEYMREASGWYEEDCDYAIVACVFPERFTAAELSQEDARASLRAWHPAQYERFYNVTLQPGESLTRDKEIFRAAHVNDFLVLSAMGNDAGDVEVFAGRGGRTPEGHYPQETKWFLVPKAEYKPNMVLIGFPEIAAPKWGK